MDFENRQLEQIETKDTSLTQNAFRPNKGRKRVKNGEDNPVIYNVEDKDELLEDETSHVVKVASKKRVQMPITQNKFGNFIIKNNHIYHVTKDPDSGKKKETQISRLLRIKTIQQDIEDLSVKLVMESYYQNQLQEKTISRKQLQKNKLTELVEYGFDITDSNVKAIQGFLQIQENFAEYQHTHKQLGWAERNEQEVFKHHKLIGSETESIYNGAFQMEPKGSFDAWEQTIKKDVLPSIPLTLALVAGFASPVVAWIAKDFDLEVILFHIFGESTMGKTTAARIFVSPFGAPTTKEGGALLKWNGTANGVIGQLVNNMGVPVAIDEASMNRMKDFTEMIYTLAEGTEKARMTKVLENRDRRRWSGVLFSTAEHPLMAKTNNNTGLQVRMMELGHVQWTDSKIHADRIKSALLNNYGHAGQVFVEYLLKLGKDKVIKKWYVWQEKCMASMPETDNLSDRIADKLALVLMAGEIVQECFNWEVNLEGVKDLLIEHDQRKVGQRTVGDEAYSQFTGLIVQHRSKFATKQRDEKGYEYWGRISQKGISMEVEILTNVFHEKMSELGFENIDVILQGWRDNGYLDHDFNKLTRKRASVQGNGKRQNFHCIKLPSEFMTILKEEPNRNQSFGETLKTTRISTLEMELPSGMNELDDIDLV